MTEPPRMVTIRQAAKLGPLTEYTLRLMEKQGRLPCPALYPMPRRGRRVHGRAEAGAKKATPVI